VVVAVATLQAAAVVQVDLEHQQPLVFQVLLQ
jgi:hypothetical protein